MENRERILQCAEELFYARGYDAAGVQEIADRAGISKPTLYYYFGSKRGLLQAILDAKFEKMYRCIQIPQEIWDVKERLHHLASAYYGFFQEEKKFHMLLMALFYSARENEAYQTVHPYLIDFYRATVAVFENCADQLGNMNGRQNQFAISFMGMINQYLMQEADRETGIFGGKQGETISGLVDQFMYGIFS